MKKIILVSLLATFVSVFSAGAQDNTYSIILKMVNGATFTIGPNEVDSISFDNGQVIVSGIRISELVTAVEKTSKMANEYYNELVMAIDDSSQRIYENSNAIEAVTKMVNAVDAESVKRAEYQYELAKQQDEINALEAKVADQQEQIRALDAYCSMLSNEVQILHDKVNALAGD